jgi:predicted DNA-binding ribbon-helix-helix protein
VTGGGRPVKRSLTLRGHRTSVSLEDEFWAAFRSIAAAEGKKLNALASEIDAARGPETGLASAIRLYVLRRLLARAAYRPADGPPPGRLDPPTG